MRARAESHGGKSVVPVPAIAAGQSLDLQVLIPCADDVHFFVRLVADSDGRPVAKARVTTGDMVEGIYEKSAPARSPRDATPPLPDAVFEVWGRSWLQPYVHVEADGFAPAAR
jgi:hypothetical protein